jgi:ABC-type transport system involved in multi-copper enzyme maturation permease subunit
VSRQTFVLVRRSFLRIRGVLLSVGLLLAGFQFLLTQVATYLMRQSAYSQLSALVPDFVRTIAGPSTLAFMSFTGVVSLGYFHPIVIAMLVGLMITIATEPAAEVEMRFVDLTLARPLGRAELISRTLIVLVLAGGLMLSAMGLGAWIGLTCCTPADAERPSGALTVSLAVNLASVMACWGGVALALAAAARRRAVAVGIASITAFGSYLLDYLGRAWEPARPVSVLSPFHYFDPLSLIAGQPLNIRNLVVLTGIGLAATGVAYVVFSRRDI